jgi:catechol 2,3-dioxygenase-like lactoylglutathione lyase family enzyme
MTGASAMMIDHVQLAIPTGSEDTVRAFYLGILGMEEIAKPPVLAARGGFWAASGSLQLHFGVEDAFVPAAKAHPGIRVGDIDALAAHFAASGVEVAWDDLLPGFRRFYVLDPVGNRLEFLWSAP